MPGTKAKLLVVDDEPSIRTSLWQIFATEGHDVRCASEGFSALVEIRREIPEMLISDLNMPGMSGFELLSVVRRRFPEIQVIAMSGAYSGSEVPSGVAADAFFQKGGGFGHLLKIMESLPPHGRGGRPPNAAPSPAGPSPVWISRYQRNSDGEGYATIECPECMGSFPKALKGLIDSASVTSCLYCGSPIRYAVVQPDDQPPFHTFLLPLQRRPSTSAPVFLPMEKLAL
jgi:CheY-like chemotaxis protein